MRSTTVADLGLGITVPAGWDVEIFRREPGVDLATVHAANFPLPVIRGDYGGGAVELMGGGAVFLALLEFDPAEATTPLFARAGVPRRLAPSAFSPDAMQRTIGGQAGFQAFANEAGRALCLYVVLGSGARRDVLVPVVNEVLATLVVDPR